jgi:hypothetical protein
LLGLRTLHNHPFLIGKAILNLSIQIVAVGLEPLVGSTISITLLFSVAFAKIAIISLLVSQIDLVAIRGDVLGRQMLTSVVACSQPWVDQRLLNINRPCLLMLVVAGSRRHWVSFLPLSFLLLQLILLARLTLAALLLLLLAFLRHL